MMGEYLLSFSSFYKAAYAKDVLAQEGIYTELNKLPVQLVKSCSTGLYLRRGSIEEVFTVLDRKEIRVSGAFVIDYESGGGPALRKIF